jgi:hypothetical protein
MPQIAYADNATGCIMKETTESTCDPVLIPNFLAVPLSLAPL